MKCINVRAHNGLCGGCEDLTIRIIPGIMVSISALSNIPLVWHFGVAAVVVVPEVWKRSMYISGGKAQ